MSGLVEELLEQLEVRRKSPPPVRLWVPSRPPLQAEVGLTIEVKTEMIWTVSTAALNKNNTEIRPD